MTNYFEIENIDTGIRELKVEDPQISAGSYNFMIRAFNEVGEGPNC